MVVCKRIEIERKPSTTYDKVCRLKRLITTKHVRYNVETKIPSALTNFNGCTDVLCCHIHEQSLSRLRLNKLDGCKWLSSASCPRTVSKYLIIKERGKKKRRPNKSLAIIKQNSFFQNKVRCQPLDLVQDGLWLNVKIIVEAWQRIYWCREVQLGWGISPLLY